jgi:hypothetical protein
MWSSPQTQATHVLDPAAILNWEEKGRCMPCRLVGNATGAVYPLSTRREPRSGTPVTRIPYVSTRRHLPQDPCP